jgi:4-azaleucine resistance transporter AzlC
MKASAMDQPNLFRESPAEEARAGLRDIAPAAIAAVPIGLLFGAVATGKGLSALEVALMSALVFAGGAQFAAAELWATPAPIAALAFSTLLINARHLLMGASLAPKTAMRPAQRWLGFFFMTDESWALAERRALDRRVTASYWFAMAAVLFAAWTASTTLGAVLGAFLGRPERFGADFAFTALFIGLIAGFGRGRVTLAAIAGSAAASALAQLLLGPPWHVAAGALVGIGAAYVAKPNGSPESSP